MWYCFHDLLQRDIDTVKDHWNTHRIRRSRYNTVSGRPDSLFHFPEHHGGVGNLLMDVPEQEIDYAYEYQNTLIMQEKLLDFHIYH